jgi:hypothetical protein
MSERMNHTSYYDIDRIFLRGLTVRDIAEPLPSFDAHTDCDQVRSAMKQNHFTLVGVRENGFVSGFLQIEDLGNGPCGKYANPLDDAVVLPGSTLLTDLVRTLNEIPFVIVDLFGEVGGIVTRSDLQDPPVRMWLFGLITLIEMHFLTLIEQHFEDDSWQGYLSNSRLEKARALQVERTRRKQDPRLLDCLQFSDKAQIVVRDEILRKQVGFASRRRGVEAIKSLEKLRNNLAHAQDIISFDWETIVALAENLESVIQLGSNQGTK